MEVKPSIVVTSRNCSSEFVRTGQEVFLWVHYNGHSKVHISVMVVLCTGQCGRITCFVSEWPAVVGNAPSSLTLQTTFLDPP